MARFSLVAFFLFLAGAHAFTATHLSTTRVSSRVFMSDEETTTAPAPVKERGVSFDQDGKSNVWAIEPKMEVSTKSSEENTQSVLIAGGGLAAAVVAAAVILTNLPDPNQF